MGKKMENIKFKKNKEKTIAKRNYYDVYQNGERIGFARRGSAPVGYWGAWEGRINGHSIITDSRENVVNKGINESMIK